MTAEQSIRKILLTQLENISVNNGYDFLYDDEDGILLCQIVFRDNDGSILATPLSFHLLINEDKGTGETVFYNSKGEFKRQKFDIYEQNSLINILMFVQERLNYNKTNTYEG